MCDEDIEPLGAEARDIVGVGDLVVAAWSWSISARRAVTRGPAVLSSSMVPFSKAPLGNSWSLSSPVGPLPAVWSDPLTLCTAPDGCSGEGGGS